MKRVFVTVILFVFYFSLMPKLEAQSFTFIPDHTSLSDTLGSEMVFNIPIENISGNSLNVYVVRTQNILPDSMNWYCSMCFGINCFPYFIDSVASTPDFGSGPIPPDSSLDFSVHVTPIMTLGTANIQFKAANMDNPSDFVVVDLTASAVATGINDDESNPYNYFMTCNYPNPFNPTTSIYYGIEHAGFVKIKVYDAVGREVAVLVDDYKSAGNYTVTFNAADLSSGVYFYTIRSGNFVKTHKMILEK